MRLLVFSLLGLAAAGCGADASSGFVGGTGGLSGGNGGDATTTGYTTSSIAFTTTSQIGTGGTSTTTTTPSPSSSSSSSGAGGGTTSGSGDCHSDGECQSGQCVAVTPGGFHVCVVPPAKATKCTGALDQCCPMTQEACPGNAPCFVGPLVPVCSGVPVQMHNVCGVDQCQTDLDCAPNQICAPAGTFDLEIRACVVASCKVDADCTAHAGGVCAPVQAPCCAASAGLFCVYPGYGGCRKNADCPAMPDQSTYCFPDPTSGAASCQTGSPACPA